MSTQPDDIAKIEELFEAIVKRARRSPKEARRLAVGANRLLHPPKRPPGGGRGNRRALPVLDPFEIFRADPHALRPRLGELNLEQLRDIVAFHAMDPRRLVMKWKDEQRVIAHIDETVQARSRKGDAFRGSSRPG